VKKMSTEAIWKILDEVKDPEIPVVSVVEMGLIREIAFSGDRLIVTMSPTFAGCPALQVMQAEIAHRLKDAGTPEVDVRVTYTPPWTSDWITETGRQKLKSFGLAPPPRHDGRLEEALAEAVNCPYCGSTETNLKNDFGSTLCRAIYTCNRCKQPFERFKPL
jgi:ring-1,2-phenylacetyl-CoA epoxidase subunit PaaD